MKKIISVTMLGLVVFMAGICNARAEEENSTPFSATVKGGDSLFPEGFIPNLVRCKKSRMESSVKIFGMVEVTSVLTIKGWQNGRCVYENYPEEAPESKYTCYFTRAQLKEISDASKKDPDAQETYKDGMMTYTADPISAVLTKFMNDGKTCTLPEAR